MSTARRPSAKQRVAMSGSQKAPCNAATGALLSRETNSTTSIDVRNAATGSPSHRETSATTSSDAHNATTGSSPHRETSATTSADACNAVTGTTPSHEIKEACNAPSPARSNITSSSQSIDVSTPRSVQSAPDGTLRSNANLSAGMVKPEPLNRT
ncbi:hypothetical protein DL93DRAFT_2192428 [Clavulina sp. PMI_390]|nr:hypothetical protein DL93DRAFT_2192428 [Clavulina sp. PMI_390]